MPRLSLRWLPLVAAVGLFALAGCDQEDVHSYDVPKPAASLGEARVKLLAAVFDVGDKDQWYFKLLGPRADVEAHAAAFAKFVESARFLSDPKNPVVWDVPPTWEKAESEQKMRFATFHPDPKNHAVELTVFRFDQKSPLLDNVNRWCDRDLGRPHLRKPDLEDEAVVTAIKAGDKLGKLVTLDGPGPRKGKHPMAGLGKGKEAGHPAPEAEKLPLTYAVPEGWKETGPRPMIANAFAIGDGGKSAEAQITTLGASFGDALTNHNRWRGQVGLPPVKSIDPRPTSIKVNDVASDYYDFVGPQGKRMLLVVAHRGQQTWFFKLIGDAQVVADHKGKFESFVQSVKFTGAAE